MTDPNANITDLFFYPKGDQYILIVDAHAKLTAAKPYDLGPYEYRVNFDLTTPITFNSAEDRARYGGTITAPEKMHPDATITIRLNNDTTLKSITVNGLKNTEKIRTYTGVRDDPFNFPALLQGECHRHGDEHSEGCVPGRAARLHALGHRQQGRR